MARPSAWAIATIVLAASNSGAWAVGPSFDCSKAQTPEEQLICSNAALSRTELALTQAYYALRQQVGEAGWPSLKSETLASGKQMVQQCGVPASGPLPSNTANMAGCLAQAHERQRAIWISRLTGPATEEATRQVEQHVALQRDLQALGFLPPTATIDGVYGGGTRTAILAWQHASDRPDTGFISNADAALLMGTAGSATAVAAATPSESQPSAAFRQGQVDRQAWEDWFGGQTGDYLAGAEYWAAHRSLPNSGSCSAVPPSTGAAWTAGCFAALQKLSVPDVRRKAEPEYRLGWNNPPPVAASPAPTNSGETLGAASPAAPPRVAPAAAPAPPTVTATETVAPAQPSPGPRRQSLLYSLFGAPAQQAPLPTPSTVTAPTPPPPARPPEAPRIGAIPQGNSAPDNTLSFDPVKRQRDEDKRRDEAYLAEMDANTQECTDTLVLNELQRGQRDRQKLTQSVLLECGGQISLLRFAMTVGLTYLMTHHTNAYNTPNDPTVDDPTNRYALRLIGEAINRYTSQQE